MNSIQKCAVAALVVVLSLTGCALPTIAGGVGGSQGGGQSGGGEQDPRPTTEPDAPDAPAPDTPGIPDMTQLPASFPADVPIVEGDVVLAVDMGSGWTVILAVGDTQSAFADASGRLTGAGFTAVVEQSGASGSIGSYTGGEYDVQVTTSDAGADGPTITYVVTSH
ncbi:hypothetical protein [Schumannella luteola]